MVYNPLCQKPEGLCWCGCEKMTFGLGVCAWRPCQDSALAMLHGNQWGGGNLVQYHCCFNNSQKVSASFIRTAVQGLLCEFLKMTTQQAHLLQAVIGHSLEMSAGPVFSSLFHSPATIFIFFLSRKILSHLNSYHILSLFITAFKSLCLQYNHLEQV